MNKSIVIIGIIALLAALGVLMFGSELERYESGKLGIRMSYSDKYRVEERENSLTLIDKSFDVPENSDGPTAMVFTVYTNPATTSPLGWVRSERDSNFQLSDGTYEEMELRGVPSVFYTSDGLYMADNIVLESKGKIIHMSVSYLTLEDDIRKDFARILNSIELY